MVRIVVCLVSATATVGSILNLDAVAWGGDGQPVLAITASPLDANGTALPAQKLLFDTGSSTLAFCQDNFADELQDLAVDFFSCNLYGEPGNEEGYFGKFYNGALSIQGSDGQIAIPQSHYSVMQQQFSMPCIASEKHNAGINGIFGVAFRQIDQATSQEPKGWTSTSAGSCPQPSTTFVQPLMQYLNDEGGVKQMGVYWSGAFGEAAAAAYLDEDATANAHYNAQEAAAIGKAHLGEFGWLDITVSGVEFAGQTFTDVTCAPKQGQPCIVDTGTPTLVLPSQVVQAMYKNQTGSVSVKLAAKNSSDKPVELKFDVQTLFENRWIEESDQQVILGLPLQAFYYTVFDVSDSSISFSPQSPTMLATADSVVV